MGYETRSVLGFRTTPGVPMGVVDFVNMKAIMVVIPSCIIVVVLERGMVHMGHMDYMRGGRHGG